MQGLRLFRRLEQHDHATFSCQRMVWVQVIWSLSNFVTGGPPLVRLVRSRSTSTIPLVQIFKRYVIKSYYCTGDLMSKFVLVVLNLCTSQLVRILRGTIFARFKNHTKWGPTVCIIKKRTSIVVRFDRVCQYHGLQVDPLH